MLKYNSSLINHNEKDEHLKTVIGKLERELQKQEESFAEAENRNYDADYDFGYLFANDTEILRQITTKEDTLQLESDINSFEEWYQKWLLTFLQKNESCFDVGKFFLT